MQDVMTVIVYMSYGSKTVHSDESQECDYYSNHRATDQWRISLPWCGYPRSSFYVLSFNWSFLDMCRLLFSSKRAEEMTLNFSTQHCSCQTEGFCLGQLPVLRSPLLIKCLIDCLFGLPSTSSTSPELVRHFTHLKILVLALKGSWRSLWSMEVEAMDIEPLLVLPQSSTWLFCSWVCWLHSGSFLMTEFLLQVPCWTWQQIWKMPAVCWCLCLQILPMGPWD